MHIAILSDTHDDLQRLERAMVLIDALKPDAVIHCGDLCGPHMLAPLGGRRASFVFGNNDYEEAALRKEGQRLGIECLGHGGQITLEGKTIGVMHGHDFRAREKMLAAGVDYLLSGHTHARHDTRIGATRLINPGALYRAKEKTFVVLNLATDGLTVHQVG